jgi:hypothetical protein
MNSGTPDSSSFSNIIAPLIIRNELRYPGQQFTCPGYLSSFLIISGAIILENDLLSGVPEFIPYY